MAKKENTAGATDTSPENNSQSAPTPAAPTREERHAALVKKKRDAGLSLPHAQEAATAQLDHDERLAAAQK